MVFGTASQESKHVNPRSGRDEVPQFSATSLIVHQGTRDHFRLSYCSTFNFSYCVTLPQFSHNKTPLIFHITSHLTPHNKSTPVSHAISRLTSHTTSSHSHSTLIAHPITPCYLTSNLSHLTRYCVDQLSRSTPYSITRFYAQMFCSLGFYLQYDLTFQFSSTLLHVRLVDGSYFKQDYHCFLGVQR